MSRKFFFVAIAALFLILAGISEARAQAGSQKRESAPHFEAAVQSAFLRLRELGEGPVGIGGRFTFNINDYVALEAEANHYPELEGGGNFGETEALVGVKVGKRFEHFGVFGKVRPGYIKFGGDFFTLRLSKKEFFALDIGAVVEFYLSRHLFFRCDIGDLVIAFNGATYLFTVPPARLGTTHNARQSLSVGVRF